MTQASWTVLCIIGLPLAAFGLHNSVAVRKAGPALCGCYKCSYQVTDDGHSYVEGFLELGCGDLQQMLNISIEEGESCTSAMTKITSANAQLRNDYRFTHFPNQYLSPANLFHTGWSCAEDLHTRGVQALWVERDVDQEATEYNKKVDAAIKWIISPAGTVLKTGNPMCGCSGCNWNWLPGFESHGEQIMSTGCDELQELFGTGIWDGDECSLAMKDLLKEGELQMTKKNKQDFKSRYYDESGQADHLYDRAYTALPVKNLLSQEGSSCPAGLLVETGM